MKKYFLVLMVAILATGMYAIEPITWEGSFSVKKNKGAVATYCINWDNTRCGEIEDGRFVHGSTPLKQWLAAEDKKMISEGKKDEANHVKRWPETCNEVSRYFKEEWNDTFAKNGLRLTNDDSEAQYHLEIVIEGIYFGSMEEAFDWGNTGAIIVGHADLTERSTGKCMTRFNLNHVRGSGHITERFRILLVFHELVEAIEEL